MKKFALAIACLATLGTGLSAQIGGSINRNAPKVSSSIEMGSQKVHIQYTSIRFGQGSWQEYKDNVDMHDRFNAFAEKKPIGMVKTSCDLKAAGKMVPAGEYKMFFTLHEKAGWILNLKPAKGDAVRWRMVLSDAGKKSGCLKMNLEPSAKDNACSLAIVFGDKQVTVPVMAAPKADGSDK